MIYGKTHRFLLRSVASRGLITLNEAENVLKTFTDEALPIADLVKAINDEIRPYQQTIKLINDETTNEEVLVFLSLGFDDATKAQNIFSPNELELFRLILEEIMSADCRQITGIHAINLVGKIKGGLTKTDAQKLLSTWCRMYYLDKEDNNYALGVRAIYEFDNYFRQNMPDTIEECTLCKQIVYRGSSCTACAAAVHARCLARYLESVHRWPCCKAEYDAAAVLTRAERRLSPTQRMTEHSEVYDTIVEPTNITQETTSEDVDMTQSTQLGISQGVSRKRKRQKV